MSNTVFLKNLAGSKEIKDTSISATLNRLKAIEEELSEDKKEALNEALGNSFANLSKLIGGIEAGKAIPIANSRRGPVDRGFKLPKASD